ncbi:MAG: hypothetical protein WDW36_004498 [Sanguina aurantia]
MLLPDQFVVLKVGDWRSYRAQLVEMESSSAPAANRALLRRPVSKTAAAGGSWAHLLPAVEPGCLLLAKQDNMQFFNQTVVLITSHDSEKGSMGYVVNKPSPLHVNELQVGGAASAPFKDTFASQRLHLGGPVHLDHVTLLHRFLGIARSHRIAEGIHMGGLPDAVRLVESGLAAPEDFHLVLGMAGWQGRQLTEEVEKGFWHVVAASSDLMLPKKRAPGDRTKASGSQQQLPAADSSMYARISKLALRKNKS